MISRIIKILFFIFVVITFCYFRLKPLYFQTVGYTYDQGRDFLKAAEIILDKNPTFIGPTTGIQGVFHGVWYYYLLVIPFLIFKGSPIGFYYFNFLIQLASFVFLIYFLNKYFSSVISFIISLLIAASPYFIFTSTFIGNNIFVLPFFLAFLILNFFIFEEKIKKRTTFSLIAGLLLGFTSEFELAFGLFLIPSYFILILFLKNLKLFFSQKKNLLYFLTGLAIPFLPRLFFEFKNDFIQTKNFLSYLFNPGNTNTGSYSQIFQERINLFFGYFNSLFFHDFILKIFVISIIFLIYLLFEFRVKKYHKSIYFFILLTSLLLFFSSINKSGFFWGNYYEGIQYLLILILASAFSIELKLNNFLLSFLKTGILLIMIFINVSTSFKNLKIPPDTSGSLRQLSQTVNYIYTEEHNKSNYCVKIYTPPAIPFTYNYLFLYNKLAHKIETPKTDWSFRKCWYIIEFDENNERRKEWIDKNIPPEAKVIRKNKFNETEVILYKLD